MKELFKRYNVSFTIVGTAIVLTTMFGECSYDLSSKEIDVDPDVSGIVEGAGQIIDDVKSKKD